MDLRTRRLPAMWVAALACWAAAADWTHLSGDAARSGIAGGAPRALGEPIWIATPQPDEEFVWLSSPLVSGGRVFLTARRFEDLRHTDNRVIALDIASGDRLWEHLIAPDVLQSWSTPAVLPELELLVVASGEALFALDMMTGEIVWRAQLDAPLVNASPVAAVGLRRNGAGTERVLITDHVPHATGTLYGVNLSPFHAADNPYQPGEIAWRADVPLTSGSTPAYDDGVVVVAGGDGSVAAFDAVDGAALWTTAASSDGFFGGVSMRSGFVYAATYDFDGSGNNSDLVKLDASDGRLVWSTPCERTDAIPVVSDDARIFLSAGIAGFGSAVKVQAFEDLGASAALLWDTRVQTGGALTVGGWTHHPVLAGGLLYAGVPDGSGLFGPYAELLVLDVSLEPADEGFVVSRGSGAGGSPAVGDGIILSFGVDGLLAFDSCDPCDMNCDGQVNAFDIEAFLGLLFDGELPCGPCSGDVNTDGVIDAFDIEPFLACLFP